jgi:hypothetical protein
MMAVSDLEDANILFEQTLPNVVDHSLAEANTHAFSPLEAHIVQPSPRVARIDLKSYMNVPWKETNCHRIETQVQQIASAYRRIPRSDK